MCGKEIVDVKVSRGQTNSLCECGIHIVEFKTEGRKMEKRKCDYCGKAIIKTRPWHKYCCPKCRVYAWIAKHASGKKV